MQAVKFRNNRLIYLDQTKLPRNELWRECRSLKDGWRALKHLKVRGAPLIGVFSAYCVCASLKLFSQEKEKFFRQFKEAVEYLKSCRPTAVNLSWALERLEKAAEGNRGKSLARIKKEILREAKKIHAEDIQASKAMAEYGYKLIKRGDGILTHCNTGFLAASGEGTALSVIYKAAKVYKEIKVYVDETRPLLQGARLTAWELARRKVPCTLICDSTAASLMQQGKISKVFVGADRIAANGDAANKIGTYSVAVLACHHRIPFYVVAPFSTFDLKLKSGTAIPIEQRTGGEVKKVLDRVHIAPEKIDVFNPAFDLTPHRLITALVTDRGTIFPPFKSEIKKLWG